MESFAPLLTLFLIYFLFALPVRKLTRAARKQQQARKPAAPAVPDDAFPEPDAPPAGEALSGGSGSLPYPEGGELRSARPSVRLSGRDDSLYAGSLNAVTGEGEDPCHEEMLGQAHPAAVRYEAASQETFDRAAEGEDPCHPVTKPAPHAGEAPRGTAAEDGFRDAVLSGIVMSEVLKRPAQRRQERAAQRQRRAEHGRMNAAARAAGRR